jgi:PPOX class probable FMN-dependent enzyme
MPDRVTSVEELRALFPPPSARAVTKQLDRIDDRCRAWLAQCPFVAVGTTNPDGTGDVSPKGGAPGFIHVLDDHHLAWGELPGNNRLDGYANLVRDPRIGLLFMIPGIGEMLRVNGTAWVSTAPALLEATAPDGVLPTVALVVEVAEAFIHCAKAARRSGLWDPERWPDPSSVPGAAAMLPAPAVGPDSGDDRPRA